MWVPGGWWDASPKQIRGREGAVSEPSRVDPSSHNSPEPSMPCLLVRISRQQNDGMRSET